MITISCTNCKSQLSIDDAFAGGVCRCQHCGTIQTVPAPQKSPRPGSPGVSPPPKPPVGSKALYQGTARAGATSGTGLDELAEAVASSGLAGSGLASSRHTASAAPPPDAGQRRRNLLPLMLIASAALIVLIGILIAVLISHQNHTNTAAGPSAGATDTTQTPSFCGIPLPTGSVIYLLDRGNSAGDLFDTLKATCYKSIAELGGDRQFQVILWDPVPGDVGTVEFPRGAMHNATSGEIENLKRDFQDISVTGSTRLSGPLKEAVDRQPQQIVIATGKWELDDSDAAALRDLASKGIRINAVQLGTGAPNAVLQEVARQTGGEFRAVSGPELREFSR
jgi:hypothetical protein